MAFLRSLGVRLIVYLNDILIINSSKEGAEADFRLVKQVLESCGFLVNVLKSVPTASQFIEFLGTVPDPRSMRLSLKTSKLIQIQELCKEAVDSREISLRALSKILGNRGRYRPCLMLNLISDLCSQFSTVFTITRDAKWKLWFLLILTLFHTFYGGWTMSSIVRVDR